MKKMLFFLTLVLFTSIAKSQTVDTAFKSITACKIVPFKATFNDTLNVTHLAIRISSNDLIKYCQLYWQLIDTTGNKHLDGNTLIEGNDYKNWDGSNTYLFQFVGKKLNLTFLKP